MYTTTEIIQPEVLCGEWDSSPELGVVDVQAVLVDLDHYVGQVGLRLNKLSLFFSSVADPDPDPGLFGHPDPDP